jgi:hypothetical protein
VIFTKAFGSIPDTVAIDCDERFSRWKAGFQSIVAVKPSEVYRKTPLCQKWYQYESGSKSIEDRPVGSMALLAGISLVGGLNHRKMTCLGELMFWIGTVKILKIIRTYKWDKYGGVVASFKLF